MYNAETDVTFYLRLKHNITHARENTMRQFNTKISKTYSTAENAEKAVKKANLDHLTYVIAVDATNRFMPVFVGRAALGEGVHHKGFCICMVA